MSALEETDVARRREGRTAIRVGLISAIFLSVGCSSAGKSSSPAAVTASASTSSCDPGATLRGTAYDMSRSKFAFGSTPSAVQLSVGTRYVGSHGALLIEDNGSIGGALNADALEVARADWVGDDAALQAHAKDYFAEMGLDGCQIRSIDVLSQGSGGSSSGGASSSSRVISMGRGVDGISVLQSSASVQFKDTDVTSSESIYWPTIPADVVATARAFRDRLKDPGALASYRAHLPASAQADGAVVIVHTDKFSMSPCHAAAAWHVLVGGTSGYAVDFDTAGTAISSL